ncbi:hypothetical protein C8R47DRAFT_1163853 [Mycena vitilis]|nr:hypothetical protein C8R47DRAFT_1172408 [Mycena vitilis]KAJ6457840.1 hypothetical protein C8R47DRAFT_1163853 [Mycena vitilis]
MHHSLRLGNISRLPPPLRVLAERAGNGAVDALSDFLSLLSDFPEHSALAIPVIFVQLDNAKIPSPAEMDSLVSSPERLPDRADFAPIIGAVLCVHAISRMIFNSVVPPESYADLWSRLHRWIIFLDIYYQHVPPHLRVSVPMHTCVASCTILLTFGKHEHPSDVIERSPGVRAILAKYWRVLVENHGIIVFDGIEDKPDGWRDIYDLFDEALLSDGVVPALIKAIRIMEDYTHHQVIPHVGLLALGFRILLSRFQSDSGHRWLVQALDAGLLDLVITLGRNARLVSPSDDHSTYPGLVQLLRRDLPGYLPYYPVALRMKRYFPLAQAMATSPAFKEGVISGLWAEFSELVEDNLGALNLFESGTRRSLKACENMECLQITEKSDFQSCSGCSLTYYCSKECQQQDWAVSHRHWCRKLASIDFPGPSSPRERAFVRAIMQNNLHLFALDIMIRQVDFIYSNPGVDFVTVFDFTDNGDYPEQINVLPVSDFQTPEMPLRLQQLARSGNRVQLHAIAMNAGPKPIVRVLPARSNSSRMLEGLFQVAQSLPPGHEFLDIHTQALPALRELQKACDESGVLQIY